MKISNEEFVRQLEDKKNKKIMNMASYSYSSLLSKEEINSCKMIGLWKAMQKYDESRNTKFTTFLYFLVRRECEIFLKKNNNKYRVGVVDRYYEDDNGISEIIEILPDDLQDVITQKFIYNMTLSEIGTKNNYSYETARRRLDKAYEIIAEHLSKMT